MTLVMVKIFSRMLLRAALQLPLVAWRERKVRGHGLLSLQAIQRIFLDHFLPCAVHLLEYTSAEFVNTSEDESSEEDVRSERMGGQRKADLSARSVSSGRERTKSEQ